MKGALATIAVAALLAGGCGRAAPRESNAVRDVVARGPLQFTVAAYPKSVWLGDGITVDLHVHTPVGYVVQFAPPGKCTAFEVAGVETRDPRPAPDGGLEWYQTLRLEALTSGILEIPPVAAKYARRAPEDTTEARFENELVTGTLKIEVRSALTTQDSVMQPRDITATLAAPPRRLTAWERAALVAAVAGLGAASYLGYRLIRRRCARLPPPILPEVWALRALAELERSDWIETGRAREFYYRVSEIVRVYIERKFGLAAPEMTTEEFLNALARDRRAVPYDAERLRQFLVACDLVKYAAYAPRREDAQQALRSARAFVDATAAAASQSAASSAPRAFRGEEEQAA